MTHSHGAAPAAPLETPSTPAWRLITTLGGFGAIAGLLIVLVYNATNPTIEAHRAAIVESAIGEVLKHPARWDTLYLEDGKLTRSPHADRTKLERVFEGFDQQGKRLGVAITAGEPGFADIVSVIFGLDPDSGSLIAMKILGQKETPGLGDKVEKDSSFSGQFAGVTTPVKGVKAKSGSDQSEITVITGATISSRTVVRVINNAVSKWRPLLAAYTPESAR